MLLGNYTYFLVDADPLQDVVGAYVVTIDQRVANLFAFSLVEAGPTVVLEKDSADLTKLNIANFDPSDSRFEYRRIVDLPSGQRQETVITVGLSSLRVTDVPEPSTLALITLGLAGLGYSRRKSVSRRGAA